MQVDAAPAQPADVPPPAPVDAGEESEEETEVSRHLHVKLNRIWVFFLTLNKDILRVDLFDIVTPAKLK